MKQFFGSKSRNALLIVLGGSLALHIVAVAVFGTIKFVSAVFREEQTFEAPPIAPPPQKEPEYVVNLQQRNQSSSPPRPKPIVVSNPSEIDIPALDIDVNVDSSSVLGRGGGGFGGGLREIREMAIGLTNFGYTGKVEGTLEGVLFDMKREPDGDPSDTNRGNAIGIIKDFARGTWNRGRLERDYYAAEKKLYASYWVLPMTQAEEAPNAFGAEREVEPNLLLAFYEGFFVPETDMRIRLGGFADDFLLVKMNNKMVLDGSYSLQAFSSYDSEIVGPGRFSLDSAVLAGMRAGEWFNLTGGQRYDMQIMLGEIPGGEFGFYLLYQTEGDDKWRIFSTKPLTSKERNRLRGLHPDAREAL